PLIRTLSHYPVIPSLSSAPDPVYGEGVGRELLPAHHRALHRGRNRGGYGRVAGSDRGARGGECAAARSGVSRAAGERRRASRFGAIALFRARRGLLMFNAKRRPAWTTTTTTTATSAASSIP